MLADGYKDTEIGVIPIEWDVTELRDIGKVSMCKRIMKNETTDYGKIPFYKIGTFGKEADAYISEEVYEEYKNKYSFPKQGDILISASGTIGRLVVYNGEPAYFQDSNIVWIDNQEDKLLNSFLFYVYKTVKWHTDGNTIARLYNENLRRIKIPLPPLKEQEKIADILSTADDKIDAIGTQIEKVETLKNGLLQKLLSEGIGHSEFKDSEIGKIPKSWEVVRLNKYCQKITDGSHFSPVPQDKETGYLIATVKDMTEHSINYTSCVNITKDEFDSLFNNGCHPEFSDVLFSKDGTIGKTFVFNDDVPIVLLSSIAIIRPKQAMLNSFYLNQVLKSNIFYKQLKGLLSGSALKRLVLKAIKEIKIPTPSLSEQKQIADILSTADEKLEVLRAKKQMYETLKKGLMQKLLSGEVRISTDKRDINEA